MHWGLFLLLGIQALSFEICQHTIYFVVGFLGIMNEQLLIIEITLYVLMWLGVVLICIVELADLLDW